ncbi:MAG: beta-galactosidase trimerization domain-containing protein [Anaerolineaceae bacterium]
MWVNQGLSTDPNFTSTILDQFQPDVIEESNVSLSPRDLQWRAIKTTGWGFASYNNCDNNSDENRCALYPDAWDVDVNGNYVPNYWYTGHSDMWQTDVLVPSWSTRVLQGLIEEVGRAAEIHEDNVGVPSFEVEGGFDDYAKQEFRTWLKGRMPLSELDALNIHDLNTFDIRAYIVDNRLNGNPKAVEDPIFREFVLFNHKANLLNWKQMVETVKAEGAKIGLDVPMSCNQFTRTGENVYGVLVSQYMDIVCVETPYGGLAGRWIDAPPSDGLPPDFRLSSTYKINVAAAGITKPIWLMGVPSTAQGNTPYLQPNFWKLIVSEGYASSAVRKIEVTQISSQSQQQPLPQPTLDGLAQYARVFKANPDVFARHPSFANVGLIYSVPTLLWRHFPTTLLAPTLQIDAFHGWARLLEGDHTPYDVIIFGHPELWDDRDALASLSRYQVLILPQVDALSDQQMAALASYVAGGGNLIFSGSGTVRDENFKLRANGIPNLLNLCHGACGVGTISQVAGQEDASFFRNLVAGKVAPEQKSLSAILQKANKTQLISTNASQAITINLYHNGDQGLFIHLLNYSIDVKTDFVNKTEPIELDVVLPNSSASSALKASFIDPELPAPLDLSLEFNQGSVRLQVPPFSIYAVIEIYDPTEKAAAEALAQARSILASWDSKGLITAEVARTFQQATGYDTAGQYDLARKYSLLARLGASQYVTDYLHAYKRPQLDLSGLLDQAQKDLSAGNLSAAADSINQIESTLTEALKPRILFDESPGQQGTIDMSRALQLNPSHPEYVLHSFGPETSFDRFVGSGLTSDYLSNYDILAIYCPALPFSQSELDAVKMFVSNGGGLLLIGNATWPCDFGGLENDYVFKFNSQVVCATNKDNPQDVQDIVITDIDRAESINKGVGEISVNWGGSLQLNSPEWKSIARTPSDSWIDTDGDGQMQPDEPKGPFTYMGYRSLEQGRILAIADNLPFQEGAWPPILFDNIVNWLALITPKS